MAVVPLRAPRGAPEEPKIANENAGPKVRVVVPEDGSGKIEITIGDVADDKPKRRKRRPAEDFHRNLALDMNDDALAALASYIIESVEADDQDRREWTETADLVAAFLGIRLDNPQTGTSAEDGTVCKTVATCMLKAGMKLWGTAYGELLPAGGPVKVEREDAGKKSVQALAPNGAPTPVPNPGGGIVGGAAPTAQGAGIGHNGGPALGDADDDLVGDDLADALEKDLNWYLTMGDRGYYPDTSKMLIHRDWVGCQIKEVFRCPIAKKPISRWVRIQDFIVCGDPSHLSESTRHTVRKKVPQSIMRRMMASGYYRDIPLVAPTGSTSSTEINTAETQGISAMPSLPRDYKHTVFQCHCEIGSGTYHDLFGDLEQLDLDEKGNDPGYPLPYRVEVDFDTRMVLAIFRDWDQGDQDHRRSQRFIKYGLIPGFGFYDLGLIHLCGNPTQAATMLERSSIDAGLFANFPGWLMKQSAATKLENTSFRLNPGEVAKVPTGGSDKLSDVIMPVPYKPPSDQALAMAAALESKVQEIAGIVEIPVGEGRIGNTPVGTIMAYIESIAMVPGAVHKQDHISAAEEYGLLLKLIAREPKVLWLGNPKPSRKWQIKQELLDQNLAPRSDPNTPSQIHRLFKVQGRVMLGGLPQFQGIADNRKIYVDAMNVLGGDGEAWSLPAQAAPPPPPDPKIQAATIKADSDQKVAAIKSQEADKQAQAKMAEQQAESQDRAADRDASMQRELLKHSQAQAKIGTDIATAGAQHVHEAQQGAVDRTHEAGLAQQSQAAAQQAQAADHAQQNFAAPLSGDSSGNDKGNQ